MSTPIDGAVLSTGASENYSVSQNSYNGFNLPKISHVARSNSLRCSSPPRREPNIPIAVQEENQQFLSQIQPYPLVHQVENNARKISPNSNNNAAMTNSSTMFSGKQNEAKNFNNSFGNTSNGNNNQPPAPLGPLQLQQHHFQQHLQQQQMLQQQKLLEQNSNTGMRQDAINNNNPQRGSITSSLNSTGVQSNLGVNGNKQEQRLTHEQFRAALQMVVSNGDPQKNLENFIKIGEGSTGTVWIAVEKNTSKKIQVLKTKILCTECFQNAKLP